MSQAGDDAHRGVLLDLLQRGQEQVQDAARDDLGRLQHGVCPERRLCDVATKVWIKDEGEDGDLNLRHRESLQRSSKSQDRRNRNLMLFKIN